MIEVTPAEQAMWREMERSQQEYEWLWDEVELIEEEKSRRGSPGSKSTESKA